MGAFREPILMRKCPTVAFRRKEAIDNNGTNSFEKANFWDLNHFANELITSLSQGFEPKTLYAKL